MRTIEVDFAKGTIFGIAIVILLWAAIFGWVEIIYNHEFTRNFKTFTHRIQHHYL